MITEWLVAYCEHTGALEEELLLAFGKGPGNISAAACLQSFSGFRPILSWIE